MNYDIMGICRHSQVEGEARHHVTHGFAFSEPLYACYNVQHYFCIKVLFQNIMKSSEIKKESFPVINNSIESVKSTEINNSSSWRVFENKNKFSELDESSLYPHLLYS